MGSFSNSLIFAWTLGFLGLANFAPTYSEIQIEALSGAEETEVRGAIRAFVSGRGSAPEEYIKLENESLWIRVSGI